MVHRDVEEPLDLAGMKVNGEHPRGPCRGDPFMASNCLFKGADVFKMAIAVAPVTNWRFYDSIYTERYMQTPQENASGYDDNSPINHVSKLKGSFLLVHGTADDNVHVQNSMQMIEALVQANKQFDWGP